MPIMLSRVVKWRDRGNGRFAVFEQHTDHNGDVYEHRYTCPVSHDINQALVDWVAILEASLISDEKEGVQRLSQEGVDPAIITRKHITRVQKAKRVAMALKLGSPRKMLKAAQYIESFTDAQILTIVSQAKLDIIRERQNYIIDNQIVIAADIREEL